MKKKVSSGGGGEEPPRRPPQLPNSICDMRWLYLILILVFILLFNLHPIEHANESADENMTLRLFEGFNSLNQALEGKRKKIESEKEECNIDKGIAMKECDSDFKIAEGKLIEFSTSDFTLAKPPPEALQGLTEMIRKFINEKVQERIKAQAEYLTTCKTKAELNGNSCIIYKNSTMAQVPLTFNLDHFNIQSITAMFTSGNLPSQFKAIYSNIMNVSTQIINETKNSNPLFRFGYNYLVDGKIDDKDVKFYTTLFSLVMGWIYKYFVRERGIVVA